MVSAPALRLFGVISLFLFQLVSLNSSPAFASTSILPFSWSIENDTPVDWLSGSDGTPGFYSMNSDLWIIGMDGDNHVHRYKGTTLDDQIEQQQGMLSAGFSIEYGARYWLSGGWIDKNTHVWYSIVHVEFAQQSTESTNFHWMRKIGMATSTDLGLNWTYQGDIITSSNSYNAKDYLNNYIDTGVGDMKLFVDLASNYFYIYYTSFWADKYTSERFEGTRVARCPIAAKMAPGCWQKFHMNRWSEPGLGGRDSDIFNGEDNGSVFWSTYLNRYIMIGHSIFNESYITTAADLSTQDWTPRRHFVDDSRMYWYNWPNDVLTLDSQIIGQSFRLYSACNGCQHTKYMTVTLSNTSSDPPVANVYGHFPFQSTNDFNPGWQRNNPNNFSQNYYNDFSDQGNSIMSIHQIGDSFWETNSSVSYLQGQAIGSSDLWGIDRESPAIDEGEVDFLVNAVAGQHWGIIFRYVSIGDYSIINYNNGTWSCQSNTGSNFPLITGISLPNDTWHRVNLSFRDQHITLNIDGNQLFDSDIPTQSLSHNAGQVGFRVFSNATAQFDTLIVMYEGKNLIHNPGFEYDSSMPSQWTTWPVNGIHAQSNGYGMNIVKSPSHSGNLAVSLNSNVSSQLLEQVITVHPNTTYLLSVYAFVGTAGENIYLGAKGFGGSEITIPATSWTLYSITFTTGRDAKSVSIYLGKQNNGPGAGPGIGYADDFSLIKVGVRRENARKASVPI
jgi:hypothetical protein